MRKAKANSQQSQLRPLASLKACRMAYINYLRGVKTGRVNDTEIQPTDPGGIEAERERLLKEQADKLELKNDQARKELFHIDFLNDAFQNICSQIVAIMETLPANIKQRLPELSDNDINMIKNEIARYRVITEKARLTEE